MMTAPAIMIGASTQKYQRFTGWSPRAAHWRERLRPCWRSAWQRADAHRLPLHVGQRSPEPFERTKPEPLQPERADDEQHEPDADDNHVELISIEAPELA